MRKRFFGISSLLMIAALNINGANPVTPNGVMGFATYNAVDAVKADGSVVKGDVWTFGSPNKRWHEGKNEAEDMYISGIAFLKKNESASNGSVVVGDQGPGAYFFHNF